MNDKLTQVLVEKEKFEAQKREHKEHIIVSLSVLLGIKRDEVRRIWEE